MQGLPHAIAITTADVTDRDGALAAIDRSMQNLELVESVLVDGGYTGQPFADSVMTGSMPLCKSSSVMNCTPSPCCRSAGSSNEASLARKMPPTMEELRTQTEYQPANDPPSFPQVTTQKIVNRLLLGLAATVAHGQQTARLVKYHANDIVSVRAKMRYTTLIQLPSSEKILEVATGDKDFWIIDTVGNYCFLHPAKEGIHSNLNLITDKGSVYSFTLDDVESRDPDLKVVIEPSDPSSLAAANGASRFVSASEVETARTQAQVAQTRAVAAVEQFRADYPTQALKFDYEFHNEKPFEVSAIYHDDKFTYIKSSAAEKFSIYEMKDGKPDLITFQLKDGTYIIPTVVDKGYLEIGKHKLEFQRKGQ